MSLNPKVALLRVTTCPGSNMILPSKFTITSAEPVEDVPVLCVLYGLPYCGRG